VYLGAATEICRVRGGEIGDLDLTLKSKRPGEAQYATVVDLRNVCSTPPGYSMVRHNWWILDPRGVPR
jgi:hypothetical protein